MTGCAELTCNPPFALKRAEGQCCPTCVAGDDAVALDRHVAMQGPSPYAAKAAAGAPVTCKGVKCFQLMCAPGSAPSQAPGACCLSCRRSLVQTGKSLLQQGKNAPALDEEVERERMADVYIHDSFGEQEKKDVKEVSIVRADKELKA